MYVEFALGLSKRKFIHFLKLITPTQIPCVGTNQLCTVKNLPSAKIFSSKRITIYSKAQISPMTL